MKQRLLASYLFLLLSCLLLAPRWAAAQVLPHTFAGGNGHSLSIHADGTLWATGDNYAGQLGIGNVTLVNSWVQVGTATNWVQVVTGSVHSLGLRADGSLWAWGSNQYGQLGNTMNSGSATAANPTPTRVGTETYTQLAAGQFHSLALRADGSLWAWGSNQYGQLGNTTNNGSATAANPTPSRVGTETYTQVVASYYYSLGLRVDGGLWAWGSNQYGQLGNTTNSGSATAANPTPTRVGMETYTQVAAGAFHSLGLRADGSLWAWGYNYYGQLSNPTISTSPNPTPTRVGTNTYSQVAAGTFYSLGLRADGSLWAWGSNYYGQLGNGTYSGNVPTPTPLATGTALPTRSAAAGGNFGLAVKADGTLWAWGDNSYGQLGDGTTLASQRPRQIGVDHDWLQVAAGAYFSLGLKVDGSLWAWGSNQYGQLGTTSTNTPNPTPVRVGTDLYTQVGAGYAHCLALRADGSLWAWGENSYGQLGNPTPSNLPNPTPTRVGTDLYTRVGAGLRFSLALRSDGSLWAWGHNSYGQLGNATFNGTANPTPTRVGTALYTQVAAGQGHSLGLRADGSLWAWGLNSDGELGNSTNNGSVSAAPTPIRVGTALYTRIAAGFHHSLGLRSDGTLYSWGLNGDGQLGLGTSNMAANPTPTQEVTFGTGWTTLAPGPTSFSSLVRTASGLSFASAGDNYYGQLGDGTIIDWPRFDRNSPLTSLQALPVRPSTAGTSEWLLAPNPAVGHATTLRGAMPGSVVQVFDALGRLLLTTNANAAGTVLLTLPVGLAPGMYLVHGDGLVRHLSVD